MINVAMRIGGRDAASGDGRYYEKRNPFTGELIARVPDAGPLDAIAAVGAASAAFKEWSKTPPSKRRAILWKAADLLEARAQDVAKTITAETGGTFGWDQAHRATQVDLLLKLVRLKPEDYRHRFPHELSGGERQRVGVARAVAADPPVVLMDEPFGALDPITREAVAQDYRRLHAELGLTTVMITHDVLEAVLLADRIAVLHKGKLIEEGTPHQLMTAAKSEYVRELMQTPRTQAARLRKLMEDGTT